MKEQTALMDLLQWLRETLPMDLDTPRMIEEQIENLMHKEKRIIMLAYMNGQENLRDKILENDTTYHLKEKNALEYYNEKFL